MAVLTPGGTSQKVMAPHLPKVPQEAEQGRRKAGKKTACLDSLTLPCPLREEPLVRAGWPRTGRAQPQQRQHGAEEFAGPHLHLPATLSPNTLMWFLLSRTTCSGQKEQVRSDNLAVGCSSWWLFISFFIFSSAMGPWWAPLPLGLIP